MPALLVELRHAARRLARTPTLVVAVIGTLGLTIGATVAVYGVVHRVVLRPLPFPEADRLVWLDHAGPGIGAERGLDLTPGLYQTYRTSTRTLAQMAAYTTVDMNVVADGEPERLEVTSATATFATTLAVVPRLGRFFTTAEDLPGGAPVAVLGEGFWLRRFGGDAAAIGRTVSVNGVAHEIIGVMPGDFAFPSIETALWVPLALNPVTTTLGSFSLRGIGRLAPGADPASAERELAAFLPRIAESIPDAAGLVAQVRLQPLVTPLKDHLVGDVQRTLWILLAAVGFVLLIGAANITALFVVRAESRQREVAVRVALGAGRATLLRHSIAESLLLSVAGGTLGDGVAKERGPAGA
ncbi:MAG: ABC transporter permease [Cytophagaceae bacterium]|nr:ABC transporter permease [Gemmatimonadaceae bacterium]